MKVSNCCGAPAFFGWGESYGMQLTEDGTYIGMCGECKEHAEFVDEEDEEESPLAVGFAHKDLKKEREQDEDNR